MRSPELFARDEDVIDAKMQMQTTKKTKRTDGSDGEKEKKKTKKKEEHKTRKDKQKEVESETTPELFAQDDYVTDAKMEIPMTKKAKRHDSSDGEKEKKKKKKEEHKTQKDKQKEVESETELCVKKDEEMKMKKKNIAKLPEGIDENNRKRGPDSGKVKKKKKQKTEDSSGNSLPINKEKKKNKHEIEDSSESSLPINKEKTKNKQEIEDSSESSLPINKEKKRKKQKIEDSSESSLPINKEKKRKKQEIEDSSESSLPINKEKKRKKKTKSVEGGSQEKVHEGGAGLGENKDIGSPSERPSPKGSSKKVRFAENVEIFPLDDGAQSSAKTKKADGLIRGKRFSKEEDEIVKKAVFEYIELHGLGDEGLKMVLHCKEHPEVKNCWKDIGKALPLRPYLSVYYRAHILFERGEKRKWTCEDYEIVRKFYDKHGADWKGLADALGKHRFHVKDTWRRIKLSNMKKGQWTQEEYQNLFDLVNMDLRLKVSEEKKSKYGMLRDNICWGAISDKLSTRSTALCCQKWYRQLTSPMVAEDEWADVDDYRLVDALSSLDACSIEDVEWEQLLEHRNGDVCRKRWSQMIKHIGDNGNKSFSEQVEVLSQRYSLDVLDARETFDNAPIVDLSKTGFKSHQSQ